LVADAVLFIVCSNAYVSMVFLLFVNFFVVNYVMKKPKVTTLTPSSVLFRCSVRGAPVLRGLDSTSTALVVLLFLADRWRGWRGSQERKGLRSRSGCLTDWISTAYFAQAKPTKNE
jgi:hypothetical protein